MNIYTTITERILNQLAACTVPWRKTWTTGLPKSLTTGREFRGINLLVLGLAEHTSRYWITAREALRRGGQVRQGEKATPVISWKERAPEELARHREETSQKNPAPWDPFISAIFNLDQVEGVSRPEDDVPNPSHRRLEVAHQMLAVMPNQPEIVHARVHEPAYDRHLDRITLPHLSQFENADEYYAMLFRGLIRATSSVKRLNRFAQAEGDRVARYSFEELVAELGTAFLCGFAGISNTSTEAQQASDIKGWSEALRQNPRWLVWAACAAQDAADYIRGKLPGEPDLVTPSACPDRFPAEPMNGTLPSAKAPSTGPAVIPAGDHLPSLPNDV